MPELMNLAIGCAQMIVVIIAQIGLSIHTNVQSGRVEKMLRWILTIANAIIAFIMLLASGYASDTGDAKTFASLLVITIVSTLNTAYILFT